MDLVVGEEDPVQRERLVRMISRLRPAWRQVAQVASAAAVLGAVDALQPQLLVLDIHLEGEDPRWIRRLPPGLATIFITVDPSMAVDAFELAAIDYVLKPVTPARLDQAFERAERRFPEKVGGPAPPGPAPLATVVASRGDELVLFQTDEIFYLQAHHKYTRIVSADGDGLVRTSIAAFERRLDPLFFKRIHRGTLLNMRVARRIWRDTSGCLRVRLPDGGELHVSRSYESVFRVL